MGKPSYLRAAIEDWVNDRISLERLCELWQVSFYEFSLLSKVLRLTKGMPRASVGKIEGYLEATKD